MCGLRQNKKTVHSFAGYRNEPGKLLPRWMVSTLPDRPHREQNPEGLLTKLYLSLPCARRSMIADSIDCL